ncbi:MAG: tetratricopeptide repeat protein [Planctomycetaceae bacterium]|nr:tetratricopeptide repeat protein [Planctomycetaceae bacterium]
MFRSLRYNFHRLIAALLRGPRAILQLLMSPFVWFGGLLRDIANWWSRREMRYLIRGLPSVFVFSFAAYLVVACRFGSDATLAQTYLSAARQAEAANSPAAAALLLERVATLRHDDQETLFELAVMAQQAGDQERAAVLIQKLAPDEGHGYLPAHLQVARYYLARQHLSEENYRRAERHLKHVLTIAPNHAFGNALLGQLYFMRGVWTPAIQHFEAAIDPVATDNAEPPAELQFVLLLLAKAHALNNNQVRAEQLASDARSYFAARVDADPDGDIQSRIILADTCLFLEQYQAASDYLADGLALRPDDRELKAAVARFNVSWAYAMQQSGSGTREQQFERLSTALLMDPNYALIYDRMMQILTDEQHDTAAAARQFLLDNVTSGRSIALSHLLLGSVAFGQNDLAAAAYHLERAHAELPNADVVQNNLAWFLAFNDPPDLERALLLIDNVISRSPEDPRFLDTRGQIYTKLERWDEAISDLERALGQSVAEPETHLALATCYAAKGMTDFADRHRSLAETAAVSQ